MRFRHGAVSSRPEAVFSDLDQSASFSHTYNFRPTLLNSFIFSYNRINGTIVSGAPFSFADIGIPIAHSTRWD